MEERRAAMSRTIQDEIDEAESKMAAALAQIELFKAHIDTLKAKRDASP
jgi:hypothetical protein